MIMCVHVRVVHKIRLITSKINYNLAVSIARNLALSANARKRCTPQGEILYDRISYAPCTLERCNGRFGHEVAAIGALAITAYCKGLPN